MSGMLASSLRSPGLLAFIVVVFLLIEAWRAARNERRQFARGGIEPADDVYRLMQLAYPGAFAAMLVERSVGNAPDAAVWMTGAAIWLGGKAIKWWAILALGDAWTFRVIVVPGGRRVTSGPYRFFTHPNYVGVVGELVGLACMTGARWSGPVACLCFGVLLRRRMTVETRALDAILRRS